MAEQLILKGTLEGHVSFFLIFSLYITETMSTNATAAAAAAVAVAVHDAPPLPLSSITSFRDAFEQPTNEEGFEEVKTVNWVFEGDTEARRLWSMWLQIDGK